MPRHISAHLPHMSWILICISPYGSGSEFYYTNPDPHHWPPGLCPPPPLHLTCIRLHLQPPFPASSCPVLRSRSILTQHKLQQQLFSPHFFYVKNVFVQSLVLFLSFIYLPKVRDGAAFFLALAPAKNGGSDSTTRLLSCISVSLS